MHPSYYYFGAPDSDSVDDSYILTRECFQIDRAITSNSKAEAATGGGNATPPHVAHLGAWGGPQPFKSDQGAQLVQIQELQAKLDEERERLRRRLRLLQQTLEREHVARIHGGGA
jgi:hypothetical protein